jgi:hypothetical protein
MNSPKFGKERTNLVRFWRMYRPRSDGIFQRMRQIPMFLCVVVALPITFLIVGCAGGTSQGQGGHEDHTTHHHSANVKLELRPEGDSGVSGTAFFKDTPEGVMVKLELRNLPKPNTLYLAHIHQGTCAEGDTHEHRGSHGGEEGYGHQHEGASHEHGAEIEYPLSQVKSDSEGHGSSTTTLRKASVEKLFSGDPKHVVNIHEAGTGNPPILTCAGLKEAEETATLYERARRTENPPGYTIGFAHRQGPEHYSIGVITEPISDKARLGAIAVTEARDRSVDHITVFFAESEAALQRRDVFGGAHLIKPKRSLTVDLG